MTEGAVFCRTTFRVITILLAIVLMTAPSRGDPLNVTLQPTTITVAPGATGVEVFGILLNTTSSTLYLNDDSIIVPQASQITDDFLNTPPFLSPGQSSALIELFSFDIASNAIPGSQLGSYSILGGIANPSGFDILGSQSFNVIVQTGGVSAPEPGGLVLLITGLVVLMIWRGPSRA